MKALIIANNELAVDNISQILTSAGYDIIVYRWILKALDNIEEISPHIIIVSAKDYPRHWKTLAQFASSEERSYKPEIILFSDGPLDEEELKKAEALNVRGIFESVDVKGLEQLRNILLKGKDIYSGKLVNEEGEVISIKKIVEEEPEETESKTKETEVSGETEDEEENQIQYCIFVFTNPVSGEFVTGYAKHFDGKTFEYIPDIPKFVRNLDYGTFIKNASIKQDGILKNVSGFVESNDGRLKIRLTEEK